ncbi:MAG: hypothetical protein WCQ47_05890 [bacterium]
MKNINKFIPLLFLSLALFSIKLNAVEYYAVYNIFKSGCKCGSVTDLQGRPVKGITIEIVNGNSDYFKTDNDEAAVNIFDTTICAKLDNIKVTLNCGTLVNYSGKINVLKSVTCYPQTATLMKLETPNSLPRAIATEARVPVKCN